MLLYLHLPSRASGDQGPLSRQWAGAQAFSEARFCLSGRQGRGAQKRKGSLLGICTALQHENLGGRVPAPEVTLRAHVPSAHHWKPGPRLRRERATGLLRLFSSSGWCLS